jgi:hypothetical protein
MSADGFHNFKLSFCEENPKEKIFPVTLFRGTEAAILTMKTLTETRLWSEGEAA